MKKPLLIIALILSTIKLFAQQTDTVAMADQFRADGKIYVVIGVLSLIFLGIIIFLFSIERRLKHLEKKDTVN